MYRLFLFSYLPSFFEYVYTFIEEVSFSNPLKTLKSNFGSVSLYLEDKILYVMINVDKSDVFFSEEQQQVKYNVDKKKSAYGAIYTQNYNSKDFSDYNTIIYGHNMKNGTMFKTLHNYEKEDFFNENLARKQGKIKKIILITIISILVILIITVGAL